MKQRPVIYEQHPVSVERKAELKSAGYIIMDAAHKPEGYEAPVLSSLSVSVDAPEIQEIVDRIGQYKAEHDLLEQLIVAAEGNGELVQPEAGELPIRLHEALVSIRVKAHGASIGYSAEIERLKAERDEWFDTSEALQKQLESLQSKDLTEEDKVAALKAKLDAAGKQYRANASIESLEAAVAELPQA